MRVRLYDSYSNKGIPNKRIFLEVEERINQVGSHHYSYDSIAAKNTDANGYVDFGRFDALKNSKYTYFVGQMKGGILNGSDYIVTKGEDNFITINDQVPSTLTFNFFPPPPYGTGDSLRIDYYRLDNMSWHGIITDISYLSAGNQDIIKYGNYYFNIDKFKSGVYTNTKDTVFYNDDSAYFYNVNW